MTTQPTNTAQRDRDVTEYLYKALREIPIDLAGIEVYQANLANSKREADRRLEDAELNALLSAPQDGANEKAREMQRKKAISDSPEWKQARKEVMEIESEIENSEAEAKSKRREFQAAIALAELHAARINLMAKIQTQKDVTK